MFHSTRSLPQYEINAPKEREKLDKTAGSFLNAVTIASHRSQALEQSLREMSVERHGDGSKVDVASSVQAGMEPTGSSSSSSWRTRQDGNDHTSPPCAPKKKNKREENDEDLFMVPDMEARPAVNSTGNGSAHVSEQQEADQAQTSTPGKRRRGRNPVDKEYKRLKRLLRNRVSAQQARERKKVYVNDLESRAGELEDKNSKLEEKISTLINENTMLRKVLMNTRPKVDESAESTQ